MFTETYLPETFATARTPRGAYPACGVKCCRRTPDSSCQRISAPCAFARALIAGYTSSSHASTTTGSASSIRFTGRFEREPPTPQVAPDRRDIQPHPALPLDQRLHRRARPQQPRDPQLIREPASGPPQRSAADQRPRAPSDPQTSDHA